MERSFAYVSTCVALVSLAVPAKGEDNEALAAELFAKGVKAREAGKCDDQPVGDPSSCQAALEFFRRAHVLSPQSLGVLRNLAYAERSVGLVASSSKHFRELARKAPADPSPERRLWAKFAKDEADALDPRVPHLTIKVLAHAGVVVTLDGDRLPDAAVGVPIDVDPGLHRLEAKAPDTETSSTEVRIAEKDSASVELTLVPRAAPPPALPVRPVSKRANLAPIIVLSVGAAGAVLGGALGVAAVIQRGDHCADKLCDSPGALDTAKTLADVSTVALISGLTVTAAGLVWLLLAPSRTNTAWTPRSSAVWTF